MRRDVSRIVTALILTMLDHWVFVPIPSVAALINNAETGSAKPNAWQGLLASFYGAVSEEILLRLGALSVLALAFRTMVRRMRGANRELAMPIGVFWAANFAAAVLFGLGHLPATAALTPLSAALIIRAVVLNGMAGMRLIQTLRIGVGDGLAFWCRYCRPCRLCLILN